MKKNSFISIMLIFQIIALICYFIYSVTINNKLVLNGNILNNLLKPVNINSDPPLILVVVILLPLLIMVLSSFFDLNSKVFQKEEIEVRLKASELEEQKNVAEEIIKEIEKSSRAEAPKTIEHTDSKEPTPKEVENFKMTLSGLVELMDKQKKQLFLKPNLYLLEQIEQSESIAKLILNRSGVYLIYGIVMAMVGIIVFISINIYTSAHEWTDQISRVAGLLFIQAIAFYLLKQHRVMMEEYRYYEGLKRRRQDAFTMLMLFKQSDKEDETIKYLIDKGFFSDYRRVLNEKETTEVLETAKQNDTNVLESLTKLVEQAKGLTGGGK